MMLQKDDVMERFRVHGADELNRHLWQNMESRSQYQIVQEFNVDKDFGKMVVDHLITSLDHASASMFTDFLSWLSTMMHSRGLSDSYVRKLLNRISEIIESEIPNERAGELREHLNEVREIWKTRDIETSSFIDTGNYLGPLALGYLDALLEADRNRARKLIMDAVEEKGISVKDIYISVFQATQYEIGRLWQLNEITVAQEHYSTAVTQMIMSQLYPHIFNNEKKGYRMIASSVGSELHEIGIRMVADFFEIEGWDTYYLGANVPADDLITEIRDKNPHVLALSATMAVNLPLLEEVIAKIRAQEEFEDLKILVGGYPFQASNTLHKDIGADGFASDAREAIKMAEELISNY